MSTSRDGRELGRPLDAHLFDEQLLASFLAEKISGFTGPCEILQFLGGQSNPTFLLKTPSRAYVMRKKPPGKLLPSAHAVDREFRVISALAGTSVPVAKTHILCADDSVIGQMFYIMDYVPGRVLTERGMPSCTGSERSMMYHSMVAALGTLHAVDYKAVGLEDFGRPSGYIARQIARWSKQYKAARVEHCPAMEKLMSWLPNHDPGDEWAAIVHGDYRPGNVIFSNSEPEMAAILDWELSTIGNPMADLGYFLMPHRLDSQESTYGLRGLDLSSLGIPDEASLLQTYAKNAGRASGPNIDYYIVFSMFRLAAIQAGVLRRGLDGNAADPRAIERGRPYKQMAEAAWAIIEGA
ncbi:MAG: phosphotransferase family protein [Hyphomicrobiaceae bacterium]